MGVGLDYGQQKSDSLGRSEQSSSGTQGSQQTQSSSSAQTTPEQLQAYFGMLNGASGGRVGNWAQSGTGTVQYDSSAAAPVAYRGDVGGRVSALLGAASPVAYQGVTAAQVQALGGLGASRSLSAAQAYGDRAAQLRSDPSMTLAQRQYAGGLNTRELAQTQDAIAQEREAAISNMMQEEALRQYTAAAADRTAAMSGQISALSAEQDQYARQYAAAAADRTAAMDAAANRYTADVRNADLSRTDAQALAEIIAKFMGQNSQSAGQSTSWGQNQSYGTSLQRSSGDGWNANLNIGATK